MTTLRNLRKKISTLEIEKANLMAELEELREKAETIVNSLENELEELRKEAASLKELLEEN